MLAAKGSRNASYLLEQAAEKVIIAVLTTEAKHAGVRHQLDEMVKLVPDENPLKPGLKAIEALAAYATAFRYTGTSGRIRPGLSADDFEGFAIAVDSVLNDAAARLGVDLTIPNRPATRSGPVR